MLSIGFRDDESKEFDKEHCIRIVSNQSTPAKVRSDIQSIWASVTMPMESTTDQKTGDQTGAKKFLHDYALGRKYRKNFSNAYNNADNPNMAMCFGYPKVEYYKTYQEALGGLKGLNPKVTNIILGFNYPGNQHPGKEHIKKENVFDPRNPQQPKKVLPSSPSDKNEQKTSAEQKVAEKKLAVSQQSESKKATLTPEKLEAKYINILNIIRRKIEKLPEYKGDKPAQIMVVENNADTNSDPIVSIKSVSSYMEKIHSMAAMPKDKVLERFGYFRTHALLQVTQMDREYSLTLFRKTIPEDHEIGKFIKDLLETTLKDKRLRWRVVRHRHQ